MERMPDLDQVRAAWARISAHVHRTPVLRSRTVDARAGAEVLMKCEHLQRAGAFKARGALNAVFSLSEPALAGGVATHSSGNHGAALALAARIRGVAAHVVVPENAPQVKRSAMLGYGARLVACEPTLAAREAGLREVVERTGAAVVHPYDDWHVIAGQGTAALELIEDVSGLDAVVVPVGGGGLLAGTAIAVKGLDPRVRVIGVEPAGADDAARGFRSRERVTGITPTTIADGLRAELGVRNFEVATRFVDDIVTVSDTAIVEAMRFMWERTKQLVEPSAATVIAALFDGAVQGARVGVVLSGGNTDLDSLPWSER